MVPHVEAQEVGLWLSTASLEAGVGWQGQQSPFPPRCDMGSAPGRRQSAAVALPGPSQGHQCHPGQHVKPLPCQRQGVGATGKSLRAAGPVMAVLATGLRAQKGPESKGEGDGQGRGYRHWVSCAPSKARPEGIRVRASALLWGLLLCRPQGIPRLCLSRPPPDPRAVVRPGVKTTQKRQCPTQTASESPGKAVSPHLPGGLRDSGAH